MTTSASSPGPLSPGSVSVDKPNIYPSSSLNPSGQESRNPSHSKHDSKLSIATKSSIRSTRSHKEYLDSLEVPCKAELERISTLQEHKEEEAIMKRLSEDHYSGLSEAERIKAAQLIQRNYRGHRERRMLEGMSLDPSTRWIEAIKEARYRNMTQPRARASADVSRVSVDGSADVGGGRDRHSAARQHWKKIGLIARRAGGDEDSETNSDEDGEAPEKEQEERRKRRMEENQERQKAAKMMDLQYFLEMVDLKHR